MLFDYRASVSDLHLFREEPALWLLKHNPDYLYRTESGYAAQRGHAVEHGLRAMLRFGLDTFNGVKLAQRDFMRRTMLDATTGELPTAPDWEKELANIIGYVEQGAAGMDWAKQQFQLEPRYEAYQHQVEATIDGVRLLGYTDFLFGAHGIDLKSTARLPSEMRDTHIDQMAFYRHTLGVPFSCLYCSPKKWGVYTLTDEQYELGMQRLRLLVRSVKVALSQLSWDQLFDLYPPRDVSSFRWDEKSRFFASNIWKF